MTSAHQAACRQYLHLCHALAASCCRSLCTMKPPVPASYCSQRQPSANERGGAGGSKSSFCATPSKWDDCGVSYTVPCGPEGSHPVPHSGTGVLHLFSLPSSLFHFPIPHRGFLGSASKLPTCIYILVSGSTFGRTHIKTIFFLYFFWTPFPICLKHQSNPS